VATDRINGRGRRWDLDNAEAMMALEGLYPSSGLGDPYGSNAPGQRNERAPGKTGTPGPTATEGII
jgi:hypothetical protein